MQKEVIASLDIGATKILVLIAEFDQNGYDIIGVGQHIFKALRKGIVVNIDATVEAIQNALADAELMSDCKVRHIITGVAGSHLLGFNSTGIVAVRDKEIKQSDIDRVMETAYATALPSDHQVLDMKAQDYIVDGQDGLREPIGMSGVRLEVKAYIATGATGVIQNIRRCVNRSGLEVSEVMLQPVASSDTVLSEDERDLGVVMIDIGGGTTDIAIYINSALRFVGGIAVAGEHITNDIAMALRITKSDAEQVKIRYGIAKEAMASAEEKIDIELGEREDKVISRHTLAAVIEPRIEEIFALVREKIDTCGIDRKDIKSGIVITGGASLMPGVLDLAEEILQEPCRLGEPLYQGALADIVANPRYATALGFLNRAWEKNTEEEEDVAPKKTEGLRQVFRKLMDYF